MKRSTLFFAVFASIIFCAFNVQAQVIYSEGFESITSNDSLPGGMAASHLGSNELTYTSPQMGFNQIPHTGNKFASFFYQAIDDYFFTPSVALIGGQLYTFSFWYITDGHPTWNLDIKYGSAQNGGSMVNVVTGPSLNNLLDTTYAQWTGTLTPTTSGNYYFGIHSTTVSGCCDEYMSIDDIEIASMSPCNGMPVAGATVASQTDSCLSTLSLSGASTNTGLSYQWYSSLTGATGSYTAIGGANNNTLSVNNIDFTTYFQCAVTCTVSALSATSTPVVLTSCKLLPIKFYYDNNGNCSKDTSELYLSQPAITEVDSNGIPVDTISSTSGFYYTAYGNPGDIYTFKVLSLPTGFSATCPASGIVSDTLQSNAINNNTKLFGLSCNSGNFDLAEYSYIVAGINDAGFWVTVENTSCLPEPATLTMSVSPKYTFCTCRTYPAPFSYSGNTVTWNLTSTTTPQQFLGFYYAVPGLTGTDTFNCSFNVTPIAGDINPDNNSEIINDTVKAGSDPNEMTVKPSGYISAGTQLQYSINFENTGNDTAFNIYVMDTLSDNVDPHSLRLVMASNTMNIAQFTANGHNIVKFDFSGINLLDSMHSVLCNGGVAFNINTKAGLANGTTILNHAGVYFDYNPVVMTDTVEDIIGIPQNVPNVTSNSSVEVYPNPANDVLTIKIDKGQYSSFTIVNNVGEIVVKEALINAQTNVNVKTLPAGMYYIRLQGDSGVVVKKFVKL